MKDRAKVRDFDAVEACRAVSQAVKKLQMQAGERPAMNPPKKTDDLEKAAALWIAGIIIVMAVTIILLAVYHVNPELIENLL